MLSEVLKGDTIIQFCNPGYQIVDHIVNDVDTWMQEWSNIPAFMSVYTVKHSTTRPH